MFTTFSFSLPLTYLISGDFILIFVCILVDFNFISIVFVLDITFQAVHTFTHCTSSSCMCKKNLTKAFEGRQPLAAPSVVILSSLFPALSTEVVR